MSSNHIHDRCVGASTAIYCSCAGTPQMRAMTDARRPLWKSLYFQVLVAVALGVLVGWAWPTFGASLKPLGDGFIKLVKMIITPVIFLTVITGIASMRDLGAFRADCRQGAGLLHHCTQRWRLSLACSSRPSFSPVRGANVDPATLDTSKVATYVTQAKETTVIGFLLNIIPDTMVQRTDLRRDPAGAAGLHPVRDRAGPDRRVAATICSAC